MKKVLLLVFLIAALGLSVRSYENYQMKQNEIAAEEYEYELPEEDPVRTYVFFGLDNRSAKEKGRSDSIMLIAVNDDKKEIKIASVYRDTVMDVGGEMDKCNAAYAYGGPHYAIDMLEKNLDLEIDGFISADFLTMIETVDLLGGVDLEITDEEAYYLNNYAKSMADAYDKKADPVSGGKQHLNGTQAVAYSRIRYTEGWDYKRTERQRTLLELLAGKMREADEDTQSKVIEKFVTGYYTNLSEQAATRLTDTLPDYEMKGDAGFPKYRTGKDINGLGSCVVAEDFEKNVIWLHKYLYDEEYEPSPEVKEISRKISEF